MTLREQANKARCIAAIERHLVRARGRLDPPGAFLYGFLDAAFGQLKPSQADAGRANAIRWLRRQARKASPGKPAVSKRKR